MARTILWNFGALLVLAFLSLEYLLFFSKLVPESLASTVSFGLVPALFGCAGFFLLKARLPVKLALLALLPAAHLLYLSGEHARPRLDVMMVAAEMVSLSAGAVLGHLARRQRNG